MPRVFSVKRRVADLVDLALPAIDNLEYYEFGISSNFDAAPAAFQQVPVMGYRSPGVPDTGPGFGNRGLTRFLLNPADYTATYPALDDALPFWLFVRTKLWGVAVSSWSSPHLVLPYDTVPNRAFTIHGDAPATSLELILPQTISAFWFQAEGANDLFLSFDNGITEMKVPALMTNNLAFTMSFTSSSSVSVRSGGASTEFYATFRLLNSLAL
jgi:hypothetical protein